MRQSLSLSSPSASFTMAFLVSPSKHSILRSSLQQRLGRTQLTCMRMASTRSRVSVEEEELLKARGYSRGDKVVLFDGVCNMCNQGVNMVLSLDTDNQFKYAALQGEVGKVLTRMYGCPEDLSTMVYLDGENAYLRSDAVLKIAEKLRLFYAPAWLTLLIVPRPLRDWAYTNILAKNRYTLFGKRDVCRLPSPEEQAKFLD